MTRDHITLVDFEAHPPSPIEGGRRAERYLAIEAGALAERFTDQGLGVPHV